MLLEIVLDFMDQLNKEIHENWYSTNINETTASVNTSLLHFLSLLSDSVHFKVTCTCENNQNSKKSITVFIFIRHSYLDIITIQTNR